MRSARRATVALLAVLTGGGLLPACAASDEVSSHAAIHIASPGEESVLAGLADVRMELYGSTNVTLVEVRVDGASADFLPPSERMRYQLDTTRFEDGVHALSVVAEQTDGRRVEARRGVQIDNGSPVVHIVEPFDDTLFVEDGAAAFAVEVTDTSAISRLVLRANGRVLAEIAPPTRDRISVDVDTAALLGDGERLALLLTAEAFDAAGHRAEEGRSVTIRSRELWHAAEDDARYGPLVAPDGTVAMATSDRLVVYDADGTRRCAVDGSEAGAPLVYLPDTDAVFWATLSDFRIVALEDCRTIRQQSSPGADSIPVATVHDGRIYAATFGGTLRSFDESGGDAWSVSLATAVTDDGSLEILRALDVANDGTVYIGGALGTTAGAFFVVTPEREVRYRAMPAPLESGMLATDDGAYAGATDGRLYKVRADLERPWREDPELSAGNPIECVPVLLDESTVAVCDGDGEVQAVRTDDGATVWTYDAAAGRPGFRLIGDGGLTVSPDGTRFALGDRLGTFHLVELTPLGPRVVLRSPITSTDTPLAGRPALSDERAHIGTTSGLLVVLGI